MDGGIHRHQRAGEEDAVSKSLRRKKAERDGVDGECYDDQKIGGTLPEKDAYRTHGESEEGAREIAEAPRLGLKIIAEVSPDANKVQIKARGCAEKKVASRKAGGGKDLREQNFVLVLQLVGKNGDDGRYDTHGLTEDLPHFFGHNITPNPF